MIFAMLLPILFVIQLLLAVPLNCDVNHPPAPTNISAPITPTNRPNVTSWSTSDSYEWSSTSDGTKEEIIDTNGKRTVKTKKIDRQSQLFPNSMPDGNEQLKLLENSTLNNANNQNGDNMASNVSQEVPTTPNPIYNSVYNDFRAHPDSDSPTISYMKEPKTHSYKYPEPKDEKFPKNPIMPVMPVMPTQTKKQNIDESAILARPEYQDALMREALIDTMRGLDTDSADNVEQSVDRDQRNEIRDLVGKVEPDKGGINGNKMTTGNANIKNLIQQVMSRQNAKSPGGPTFAQTTPAPMRPQNSRPRSITTVQRKIYMIDYPSAGGNQTVANGNATVSLPSSNRQPKAIVQVIEQTSHFVNENDKSLSNSQVPVKSTNRKQPSNRYDSFDFLMEPYVNEGVDAFF